MLDFIIYTLMAWEATQSFEPWIAYINACGGGIIRSTALGLWSPNISLKTVLSILFWNFVARFIVQHNMFAVLRCKLSKFKWLISSFSTVCFGFYGLSIAPSLGWFSYYITACGGGIISSVIRSKNLYKTVMNILITTMWTFIEGVLMSTTPSTGSRGLWATIFIVLRIVYYLLEGRNLVEYSKGLKCLRRPANIGIPELQNCVRWAIQHRNVSLYPKVQIRVYGCLCRRRIVLSF